MATELGGCFWLCAFFLAEPWVMDLYDGLPVCLLLAASFVAVGDGEALSSFFLKFMGHSWPTSTGSYGGGPARCWGGLDHILGAYSGDCLAESLGKSCRSRGKSWQSPAKCLTSTYKVLVRSWPTLRGFLGDCFGGVPGGSLATSSGGSWPNFGGILGRWRVGVNGVIS